MSRRRALADAAQALTVRQLQEQAARLRVQVERHAVTAAETRLRERREEHRRREDAWAEGLRGPLDLEAVRLWRAHAEAALADVRNQEATLDDARADLSDASRDWARRMRLAEAAETIARDASRNVRRADDERRLAAAEDARMARRSIS